MPGDTRQRRFHLHAAQGHEDFADGGWMAQGLGLMGFIGFRVTLHPIPKPQTPNPKP